MSETTLIAVDTPEAAAQREAELLEKVRNLIPNIRARAEETEQIRQIHPETMQELLDAGVFRLHSPLKYGGLQLGLNAHVQVMRLIGRGCISTSWATSFLTHSANRVAKLEPEFQDRLFSENPNILSAGTNQPHPNASLEQQPNGSYLLNGRWSFASGVMNARYVEVSLPRGRTATNAETRLTATVPRDHVEIIDVWNVSGMRGTGSQDIQFTNVVVPEEMVHVYEKRAASVNPGTQLYPDFPFLRLPYHQVVWAAHAAYVLGGAEHALEIFHDEVAPRKRRPWGTGKAIDSPITHTTYGEAAHKIRTASLILEAEVREVVDAYAEEDGELSYEQRAYLNMDAVAAIHLCQEAVQILARMSGGSMHRVGNAMDRIQRDIEVLMNHSSGDWAFHSEYAGRVLLGLGLGNRPEELF